MTEYSQFVGVDISKERLDVYVHPDGERLRLANTPAGAAVLVARFPGAAFACEASGGHERALLRAATEAGAPVWRLHPADVRAFARLQGVRAKTDPIDARMIACACAAAVETRAPAVLDAAAEELGDLLALRRRLLDEIHVWKSWLARPSAPAARRLARARLASAERALARLDVAIDRALDCDPVLRAKARRITSAPGAGRLLAATLLACLPELGQISSRQAASLVGVAPHPRQSGAQKRPGRCQAGRPQVRRVLYMATLSAIRAGKAPFAAFYRRLREAGKPAKLAIVATMRKLIVALNTMLKENRNWHPA